MDQLQSVAELLACFALEEPDEEAELYCFWAEVPGWILVI
jgi:hypothetical protein